MEVLGRPFVWMWNWIDRVGGFPGQVFFCCAVIIALLGLFTWIGNRRG